MKLKRPKQIDKETWACMDRDEKINAILAEQGAAPVWMPLGEGKADLVTMWRDLNKGTTLRLAHLMYNRRLSDGAKKKEWNK